MISVKRIMGTETEFGISQPGAPGANSMRNSARVIDAYAAPLGLPAARNFWDFSTESPLQDARGFLIEPDQVHASALTHVPDSGRDAEYLANVVLPNGARYYVDHAHPEYSSPEVLTPRELIRFDRAGDRIAEAAVRALAHTAEPISLYKNNTDSKGASYGAHENYLVGRDCEFEEIVAGLLPFFATRHILCGAGRVGRGTRSEQAGFQISSRADFMEECVGLETTLRRPLVNTRDEPHATRERWRRLHVILGDATLAEPASLVRFGATALVLSLIEEGICPQLELADPVAAMHTVSHDLTLSAPLELSDGSTLTALDIQRLYLRAAQAACGEAPDPDTAEVLAEWERFLTALDTNPMSLAHDIDWVAKLALLEGYRTRENLSWDHPKLALIDLQYADVRTDRGIFYKLERLDRIRRLTTEAQVSSAISEPPTDTRAILRGKLVAHYKAHVRAISWESSVLVDEHGQSNHVLFPNPFLGTKQECADALTPGDSVSTLLAKLRHTKPTGDHESSPQAQPRA